MTHEELHARARMAVDVAAGEGFLDMGDHGSRDEQSEVLAWIDAAAEALRIQRDASPELDEFRDEAERAQVQRDDDIDSAGGPIGDALRGARDARRRNEGT